MENELKHTDELRRKKEFFFLRAIRKSSRALEKKKKKETIMRIRRTRGKKWTTKGHRDIEEVKMCKQGEKTHETEGRAITLLGGRRDPTTFHTLGKRNAQKTKKKKKHFPSEGRLKKGEVKTFKGKECESKKKKTKKWD